MAAPMERLSALEGVEKEIISCLQSAGQVLTEMGKDKPSQKQVDIHTNHFVKTLNHVELELGSHINYLTQVSTGQAHEGSSYAAQKTLQMAWHRSEHMRSKVIELERGRSQNQMWASGAIARQQQQQGQGQSGTGRPAGQGQGAGTGSTTTPASNQSQSAGS